MAFASREFIRAVSGDVETAVCGADEKGIFFTVELPELVDNKAINSVNGLPTDMVREVYALSPYEAFRLICVAELNDIKKCDIVECGERYKFFEIEQDEANNNGCAHQVTLRIKIAEVITFYNLKNIYDDLLAEPTPTATRSAISTTAKTAKRGPAP